MVVSLTDLLKKGVSRLLRGLRSSFVLPLCAPHWDRPFKIEVDASSVGAGAVQSNDGGIERPVCLFSKKWIEHQLNYSVIEKETLALI